jgi:hypothetical protein
MPQKIGGGYGQSFARFPYLNPRQARRNFTGSLLFARDSDRASLDGVLNEFVSVCLGSMQGEKQRSRPNLPRITNYLANFQPARTSRKSCLRALKYVA